MNFSNILRLDNFHSQFNVFLALRIAKGRQSPLEYSLKAVGLTVNDGCCSKFIPEQGQY
jgi:hypothetical protein